jgi:hypothetical protein
MILRGSPCAPGMLTMELEMPSQKAPGDWRTPKRGRLRTRLFQARERFGVRALLCRFTLRGTCE